MAEMYDVELGLREMARHRQRTDQLTRATADIADRLASNMVAHFGPEARETAGLAMVIAAASLAGAVEQGITRPEVLCNLLGFAGQRMVLDAWAADEAVTSRG